ncbi:MAG: hypothetical protein PHU94_00770 [Bacilli bacterium]|nr:hypothetical protein [Bacilli bacterium]MDD4733461.1 hypothetical protein [Bacilli bacterium]
MKKILLLLLLFFVGCSNQVEVDNELVLNDEINIVNFKIKADFSLIYNDKKLTNIIFYNNEAIELFYNQGLEKLSIEESLENIMNILFESRSLEDKIKITFHTESDTFEPSIIMPLMEIIDNNKYPIKIEKIEISKIDNMSKLKNSLITEALEHDISTIEDLKKLDEKEIVKLLYNYSEILIEQYKKK